MSQLFPSGGQSTGVSASASVLPMNIQGCLGLIGLISVLSKGLSRVFSTFQFSSVAQSCPTLCNPINCSMPGLPVHHQLPESTPNHVHRDGDAIQPSHPLSSPSPLVPNPSQHQGFSNESTLHMRWQKYWSFSFSISPSNEHPGPISFTRY